LSLACRFRHWAVPGAGSPASPCSRTQRSSFAPEGYRSGNFTDEQVPKTLGYGTRLLVDGFLKEHGVYLDYTLEDLDPDTETSREFSSR
jgi:hypothetical protein